MKTKWFFAFILIVMLLSACGDPQPQPNPDLDLEQLPEQIADADDIPELDLGGYVPAYMHEILDPQPGSVIPLAPYLIRFSGHSFGGIEEFEVRVDDNVIGTVPPLGYGSGGPAYGHVFYSELLWTPDDYGEYLIAVRAKASGFAMYSDPLEVEVSVGASIEIAEAVDYPGLAFLPNCDPEDLTSPSLISPTHYAYTGTTLTEVSLPADVFQWVNTSGCIPELFRILMSPDPEYGWARMGYTDDGYHTTWPPADAEYPQGPLDPATMYYWTVNAWTDGVHGPDSAMRVFFTGPLCASASELVAPQLISPHDGDQYSSTILKLHYEPGEPECLPEGYFIDLQPDSDFGGTSLVGATSSPTTYVTTPELERCTRYYWRVAATKNQTTGPFSEARSFFITGEDLLCAGQVSPFIKALKDQQCLQGPDPQKYAVLGYILADETATIMAQDIREEWWVIENPDGDDFCYVRKTDNQASGNTSDVSKWNDPEIEEEEPSLVCTEDLNEQQCNAAGGTWMETVGRASYCKCE